MAQKLYKNPAQISYYIILYYALIEEFVVICQPCCKWGGDIAFEYGLIYDFEGLVTLTLTLNRVILHTIMHNLLGRLGRVDLTRRVAD